MPACMHMLTAGSCAAGGRQSTSTTARRVQNFNRAEKSRLTINPKLKALNLITH